MISVPARLAASTGERRLATTNGSTYRRRATIRRYEDFEGRQRELISRRAFGGSILVIDRDKADLGEQRLVAHIAADEPPENAELVCCRYLEAEPLARRCRTVTDDDVTVAPFPESDPRAHGRFDERRWPAVETGRFTHRLQPIAARMSIPELRWTTVTESGVRAVSLREAIGCLESYEPLREITRAAMAAHGQDPDLSTTVLRAELMRVLESPIVLNRGLREAVLARVERDQTSMSEIASRCGRTKRDNRGNESGETSWLARRVGLLAEAGQDRPTRWVHSDVLALIARDGLGISPREVELD